ncbi:MAG: endonuclease V [Luteimonas sp.]
MNAQAGDGAAMPAWDGSVDGAHALQRALAQRVRKRDEFAQPLRAVAGFDVRFEDGGAIARVAAVLLDADTLRPLGEAIVRMPSALPGSSDPALLGVRAWPALREALARLPQRPDLAFVDGHGIAHPRRLGIAAHFGVATDLPSIGVAGEALLGTAASLHEIRGAHTPLRDHGEHVGWLLRSQPGCLPLVVSPGHRVSMTAAAQLVMRFVTDDRLPEPTRLADGLAPHERAAARGT